MGRVIGRACPVQEECARFLPKPEPAEPTAAYQAASPECSVTIIELPQAQRYRKTFAALQMKPPALVDVARWRQCVEDSRRFLAKWGEQAEALGWTSADLFGLHTPPERPHPSYNRLSRYDAVGLCWLLQGRFVTVLTENTALIENMALGTTYRRFNRPAPGPLGDDGFDIDGGWSSESQLGPVILGNCRESCQWLAGFGRRAGGYW